MKQIQKEWQRKEESSIVTWYTRTQIESISLSSTDIVEREELVK